ncbi:IMPACT family member [Meyerozyma sp. JA9]|nr:IMPACT family member [Meyerozyma sp. JA9]
MSRYSHCCLGLPKAFICRFQRIPSPFSVQNVRFTSTNWNESSIITDRKSKFQARSVAITNSSQIPDILTQLVSGNKHIAKASHPHIIAWRTSDPVAQGFKDNGEKGAGYRLLEQVLERHNVVDMLVIVTRWYGGSPIGSSRFRHINNSALESLRNANRV